MAKVKLVQTDFTTGEISPKMIARTDLDSYKHGAKQISNAYPLPHGACTSRRGTTFVEYITDSTKDVKLIPFIFSRTQSYLLIFNAGNCRILKNKEHIFTLAIPYGDDEYAELRITQVGNRLYIVHPKYQPKELIRNADDNWVLQNIEFEYNAISDQWYENSKIKFKIINGTIPFGVGDNFTLDSTGGVTWSTRILSDTLPWTAVAASNSANDIKYIAVASGSRLISVSPDGYTWTRKDTGWPGINWSSIAYGSGKWVAVGAGSSTCITTDTTALWVGKTLPSAANWSNIAYGNGKFIVVAKGSSTAALSSDAGNSWSSVTLPSVANWSAVTYGGGRWVTVATGSTKAAYSTDGINWTAATLPATTSWSSITYGTDKFVAISSDSAIAAYSTNGTTWTSVTTTAIGACDIVYGNGTFVSIPINATAGSISSDGITWRALTMPSASNWSSAAFLNDQFVVIAYNSNAALSGDGGTLNPALTTGNGSIVGIQQTGENETWSISCVYADSSRQEWAVSGSISGKLVSTWTENNWPQTVVFHEQRLYFGGTPKNPQTIWGSAIGLFNQFTLGPKDTDALQFTIASNQYDEMINLASGRYLVPLTYGGEFAMMGSNTTGITPSTIRIMPQTYHGSASMTPLKIGKEILFAQRDNKKIRAVSYSTAEDANTAPDISILAEHLLTRKVKESTFAQDPDYVSWWVMEDGSLLSCVHIRDFSMTGWSKHDTDGLFKHISSIPEVDQDTVYLVVERTNSSGTHKCLEYFDYTHDVYADSSLTLHSDTATVTWTGLDHLEGKSVCIVADGVVHPKRTVSSGTVVLDEPANDVIIGLQFTPFIEVHHPIIANELGTSQNGQLNIGKIIVDLADTVGLKVNNVELPFRRVNVDDLNSPLAKFTGSMEVKNLGWGKKEYTRLEQPYPLPWTVLSTTLYVTGTD